MKLVVKGLLFLLPFTLMGCMSMLKYAADDLTGDRKRRLDLIAKGQAICGKYGQPQACLLTLMPSDMERLIEAKGGLYGQDYNDFVLAKVAFQTEYGHDEPAPAQETVIMQESPRPPRQVHCMQAPSGIVCSEY